MFLPLPSQHFLCSASLCRRDFMPAADGVGSSTRSSLFFCRAELTGTISASLLLGRSGEGVTAISSGCAVFSCPGSDWTAGRVAVFSREEVCRTLAGPTGGFLSVTGSGSIGATSRVIMGSWFSSPATGWAFSPEHLRLEGEGLEDTCGTERNWWGNKQRVERWTSFSRNQSNKCVHTFINDWLTDHTICVSQWLSGPFDHLSVCCVWSLCHFLLQVFSASPGPLQQFLVLTKNLNCYSKNWLMHTEDGWTE